MTDLTEAERLRIAADVIDKFIDENRMLPTAAELLRAAKNIDAAAAERADTEREQWEKYDRELHRVWLTFSGDSIESITAVRERILNDQEAWLKAEDRWEKEQLDIPLGGVPRDDGPWEFHEIPEGVDVVSRTGCQWPANRVATYKECEEWDHASEFAPFRRAEAVSDE